jgi:hypothetical protein
VRRRATCNGSNQRAADVEGRPKQPYFLKLRARGNDAAWRRATCNSSSRTSQRPGAWVVKVVKIVRVVAGFARAEAEAWRLEPAGWPGGNSRRLQPINATEHANSSNTSSLKC